MSHAPMTFRSNSEIAIHAPDLDRAEGFYCGVLGGTLVQRTSEQLTIDTGALRLYVNRDPLARIPYIPSFDVPDYEAAKRHLLMMGCTTVPVSAHSNLVYFSDPFGFVFDIVERA